MAKKIKNERCPLQKECGESCEYVGVELDCTYYKNNGIGDNAIPDQEELRKTLERLKNQADEEAQMAAMPDEDAEFLGATNQLVYIPVDELYPHPHNPRKELGDLTELADSIRSKGIMQNLTVIPREEGGYTVLIGHRRHGAAKLAGLTEVPCVIVDMSPKEQVATMLLENMQRSDLTVYEQTQGFQLMFDLGESVDGIAAKTGFSTTTVRRRLKMAELNQDTLKEVSDRQLTLADFDRLAQIEDIEQRNECLKEIGTPNFNQAVAKRIKEQAIAKMLPIVKAELKKIKAKQLTQSEKWNGKFESVGPNIPFYEWDPTTPLVPKVAPETKLYYYLDKDWGRIQFYIERTKAKPQKRPQAEIDRERYIADVRTQLTELSADTYRLRAAFVDQLSVSSKNLNAVMKGAITAATLHVIAYVHSNSTDIYEALGLSGIQDYYEKQSRLAGALQNADGKTLLKVIYAIFGDRADQTYFSGYSKSFPTYDPDHVLDALYDWLISLGYEMSDDERRLRDGTHRLFVDKDAGEGTPQ